MDRSSDEGKHWNISFVPLEPDNAISGTNVALWDGVKRGCCGNVVWKTSCAGMALFSLRCGSLLRGISICCYEAHAGQFFAVIQSTMALRSVARATSLPNNNSGIDLVSMQDGTLILALNPVNGNWGKRYPLSLIASRDNGESWLPLLDWKVTTVSILIPLLLARGRRTYHLHVEPEKYRILSITNGVRRYQSKPIALE